MVNFERVFIAIHGTPVDGIPSKRSVGGVFLYARDGKLKKMLSEIRSGSEITVSLLCTRDGFPIAFSITDSKENTALLTAAMTAAVHSIANQAITELGAGNFRTAIIEGDKGTFLVKELTNEILFCCHIPKTNDTGLGARIRSYIIGVALSTMEVYAMKLKRYVDDLEKTAPNNLM